MTYKYFSKDEIVELHTIIKQDIAELFFTLFVKKNVWQSAMKESIDITDDEVKYLNEQINNRIDLTINNYIKEKEEFKNETK